MTIANRLCLPAPPSDLVQFLHAFVDLDPSRSAFIRIRVA